MLDADRDALNAAIVDGKLDVVEEICNKKLPPQRDLDHFLHRAAENGHLDIVKFLHEKGAALDIWDDSPIRDAISKGHRDVVKYLVENGVDVAGNNDISFQNIVKNGDLEIVKLLCEHGASKSKICYQAALYAQKQIVEYLLEGENDVFYDILLKEAAQSKNIGFIKYLEDVLGVPRTFPGSSPHKFALLCQDYHIADIIEDRHNFGENPRHDAYKKLEDPLLEKANPLVYNVDLSNIEQYAELSKALKGSMQLMLFANHGGVPQDLLMPIMSKIDAPKNLNYEAAMNLDFPTNEEIESVKLDASWFAKAWIKLLEKNQKQEIQKS